MGWDTITGISSVTIALCALVFTIWQSKQTQKHNKLSFKPHLTSWSHEDPDNRMYYAELMNNGLGPAIIESFTVKVDGKTISGEGSEVIEKALKIIFDGTKFRSHQAYMAKGYSMSAKEKRTLVAVEFDNDAKITQEAIGHNFKRVDLIIKYKSLYDEEFDYSSVIDKSNK